MTRRQLPRVYFTVDDQPVAFDNGWSANTSANLGHDQFRGRMDGHRARGPQLVEQGMTLKAYAANGEVPFWEGRVSGPPKQEQDGTATIAAQGHAFAALKYAGRLPIRVSDGGAWRDASQAPLNWPTDSTTTSFTMGEGGALTKGTLAMNLSPATDGAIALWVPGARFVGISGQVPALAAAENICIYTATGPDIAANHNLEAVFDQDVSGTGEHWNVTFRTPQDCVVIAVIGQTGSQQVMFPASLDLNQVEHPGVPNYSSVYAEIDPTYLPRARQSGGMSGAVELNTNWMGWKFYAHHAVRGIGDKLGWDTSLIGEVGQAPYTQWDWAGGAASGLDDLAAGDDLCWLVLHDAGNGPVMRLDPYDARVYEVSARTGARWDLDPLELYNRVVTQFIESTTGSLANVAITADPDPLASVGITNELSISIANKQYSRERANVSTYRALVAGQAVRYRGRISAARIFDAFTGAEVTYDVLPGTLRIRDYSTDGSDLPVRIADIQYGPGGVAIGVEAPALPIGPITGGGTAGFSARTLPVPFNPENYLPPGAPGGPAPIPGGAGAGEGTYEPKPPGGGIGGGKYK